MSERLVIVGGSARAAAFSAIRAGWTPVAADLFADVDLRSSCSATRLADYPRELIPFFAAQDRSPWMYTGSLENHPSLVDQIAVGRTLFGNGGSVLRQVRDPRQLAAALAGAGLPFPEVRTSVEGLPTNGTWLRKVYRSSAGLGVKVYRGGGGRPHTFFQRRVAGVPCGAVYVSAGGQARLLGITRQLLGSEWGGPGEFCYVGSIGPLQPEELVVEAFRRIGTTLAERFDLVGLFGVDAVVDGATVFTIEVNPRYTASVEILERSLGTDSIGAHVAACRDGRLRESPLELSQGGSGKPCGKAIVYARRDHVVVAELVSDTLTKNADAAWPLYADIPSEGTSIRRGEPILTLLSEGDDLTEVERQLRERLERTLVEKEQFEGC